MSDIEFLPCPFCGNTGLGVLPILIYHDDERDVVYVCCEACDAQGPAVFVGSHSYLTQANVVQAKWNKRPGRPDSYIPANQDVPF